MTVRSAASVRDALDGAVTAIGAGGSPSPRLDAELLLADALDTTRERLFADPDALVGGDAVRVFQSYVRRRAVDREPVAYILGRRAFRGLELAVDARVLIPRPETELLVELALGLPQRARVLDCCCGSGAVALALKHERPDLSLCGSDIDRGALAVAAANAAALRLDVSWQRSDLLSDLGDAFDAIVANPPYVERAMIATLEPEISRHEPRAALDGGPSGLETITRLIEQASRTQAATLIIEHGAGQERTVGALCVAGGYAEVTHHRDLGQIDRAVVARR